MPRALPVGFYLPDAMGATKPPKPVKLFVGMLAPQLDRLEQAEEGLKDIFGPVDFASLPLPWEHSRYYARELGDPLLRKFIFFTRFIRPDRLAVIKRCTNDLEERMGLVTAGKIRRRINLDPGYLSGSKVVLATTKDFSHRIYLQKGIYAEVTLVFQGRSFQPLPTTYPDYRSKDYLDLFNQAREICRRSRPV